MSARPDVARPGIQQLSNGQAQTHCCMALELRWSSPLPRLVLVLERLRPSAVDPRRMFWVETPINVQMPASNASYGLCPIGIRACRAGHAVDMLLIGLDLM